MALAVASLISQVPGPSPSASPSPMQMVVAAFEKLQSYPVAPYTIEVLHWHVIFTPFVQDPPSEDEFAMRYAWRASDGKENYTNAVFANKVPHAGVADQFIGPFALPIRSQINVPREHPDMTPDFSGLKTIAEVVAHGKPVYDASIAGIDSIGPHKAYHLVLRPTIDPQRHNLRDLWVDTETNDVWRVHFVGFYGDAPAEATTEFTNVGVYHISYHKHWEYAEFGQSITDDVSTQGIVFVQSLPDWIFDERAYQQHENAGDPDIVGITYANEMATPQHLGP